MQPDITQPSIVSEQVEHPNLRALHEMPSVAPSPVHQPEVSLPQEPAVPDISSIMSAVDQSSDQSGVPVADTHPLLGMEMPQIPPNEVSSLLGTTDEHPENHEAPLPPTDGMPQMENMGYDGVS